MGTCMRRVVPSARVAAARAHHAGTSMREALKRSSEVISGSSEVISGARAHHAGTSMAAPDQCMCPNQCSSKGSDPPGSGAKSSCVSTLTRLGCHIWMGGQVKSSQVKPSQVKPSQVSSSQISYLMTRIGFHIWSRQSHSATSTQPSVASALGSTQPQSAISRTQPQSAISRTQPHSAISRTQPHSAISRTQRSVAIRGA